MLLTKISYKTSRYWLIDLFNLALLLGLFYAIWIGSHALFTPDEGRYSEVAREMIVTGDYITPRLNGVVFLDKPILYYWLQASAIKLFGLKEWALRLWPALIGILGCLLTYLAGNFLFNRRTGLLSAIILATSPLYYGAAHYANLDLEVAVFVSSSLLCFITGISAATTRLKNIFLISAYVFAGLAALTKGLIGIVFPMMIIGAWIVLLNRWNTLGKMRLISGLLIFTAIALPWYILVQKANPEFFEFFFMKQQVSRFLTTEHFNNRTSTWFYIPIVILGAFPWCIFLIQALVKHIQTAWRNRQEHSKELFLLLWFFLIFIFFSIPKSKTVGYILPIFPTLALLIGNYLSQSWDQAKSKGISIGIITFIFLCAGITITCLTLPLIKSFDLEPQMVPYMKYCALLFCISGIITLFFFKKKLPALFTILSFTAASLLLLVSASSGAINQKTVKPLAVEIKQHLQPNDEIVTFYKYYQDLPIYLERRITIVADWNASDIPLNDNWVRELWYGMPFQNTKDWLINEEAFWQRWHSNKRLFVFTDPYLYAKMQKKSKIQVYKIAQYNKTVLVSNKPDLIKDS